MNLTWKINNENTIGLVRANGELINLKAEEIFLVQFGKKKEFESESIDKPSESLPEIEFSKYPVNIKILLENSYEINESFIKCKLFVEKNNKNIGEIKVGNLYSDHLLINNTWFPIVKGVIEEVKALLVEASIFEVGKISLKQYMILRNIKSDFIIDKVQESGFSKTKFISSSIVELPHFNGNLYPYQNQGYRWLKMIVNENAGCILADEMGLGKTAQVIAVLSTQSKSDSPSLVVAPVSLLENWRREIMKFAPGISTMIHQGQNRTGFYKEFQKYDLVITSYETIFRDLSIVQMIDWNIIIADEAQAIKNPFAKRTKAIKGIKRNSAIAVTGTPVENRLEDIWSLTDFVFPGYLGNLNDFKNTFPNDIEAAEKLEPIISPILLRRKVNEVAKDLPSRIDVPQVLKLNNSEAVKYEELRIKILEEYGKKASLVSLIKLRMFCTHPFLQYEEITGDPANYSKYGRLLEVLEEIMSNKEKVIIFTSYQKMIDIFMQDLQKRFNVYCNFIDGRVSVEDRQTIIDTFSKINDSAILILNPKAAGAGLNITAANHVIHYTLEWNPAVEDQASARAHRRGQTRPVTIHRLYCAETVEEVINERIEGKRDISEAAVIGTDGLKSDKEAILNALLRSPIKGGE